MVTRPADDQWRRPTPSDSGADADRAEAAYPGPPPAVQPPPGWHPAVAPRTVAPRPLPALDHDAIDLAEERADRFTNALGIAAGIVLILVACVQWRT
ncbi:hypothetical protein [Catellatospora methionotrophica]|uniref:hypothetical protein n=1 Tax=Catellatospora methionotrophica TaxID=121620 RepID=UPI0033F961D6